MSFRLYNLGVQGMGVAGAKLNLYTSMGGIDPADTLVSAPPHHLIPTRNQAMPLSALIPFTSLLSKYALACAIPPRNLDAPLRSPCASN